MGLGGVISNLRSLSSKLLPFVSTSAQQVSSSSSSAPVDDGHEEVGADLQRLMKMLEGIEAMLYDAEERVIKDCSVKLWLKELKQVAYDAEDVLDEYHYEVLRVQVEERNNASPPNPHKRKQVQVPNNMFSKIKKIMERFDEVEKHRRDFRLFQEDAPRRIDTELQTIPTGHFVVDSNIFGREGEKEDLIDMLSSDCCDGNIVSVVTIVGLGELGKTTLAQLVYNDQRIKERFDKFGWVCVSEDFNIERLTKELVECITKNKCAFTNLSALQGEICEAVRGKRGKLLVLDDVWNENTSLWENFQAPLWLATLVKILATTRNEPVAQIMQTMPTFKLGYLSEEKCWQLFQHYAFGQVNNSASSKMLGIGKKIMKKCGLLPLAIKLIASLLRHEKEEESWREILKSKLWTSDKVLIEIFRPLQISFARLPTYLKPCLLFCSIFPKDYTISLEKLVQFWICNGYIKSNGKNNKKKIGKEYAKQLWLRSFLEGKWEEEQFPFTNVFKLHDIVHDLARFNSGNEYYSIEAGKILDVPKELSHLFVGGSVELLEPVPSIKINALRTLIIDSDPQNVFGSFDLSKAQKVRALRYTRPTFIDLDFLSSVDNFKHLRYLYLEMYCFESLPEGICSLYNLQYFELLIWKGLNEFPKSIGNLISLEELIVTGSNLKGLPESFCQLQALRKLDISGNYELEELPTDIGILANLQNLSICDTCISYLPPSLNKLTKNLQMRVSLSCMGIDWLKDFVDLGGYLCLSGLAFLRDVQGTPLRNMQNLECLELCWGRFENDYGLEMPPYLKIEIDEDTSPDHQNNFALMVSLQPHPNIRELYIYAYCGVTFPEWIRNPISCRLLSKIVIADCTNIVFLPFGRLCSLKYLEIRCCSSLRFLGADSLPSELQKFSVADCEELKSVSGMLKLKSLVEFSIIDCKDLQLVTDVELSDGELTMPTIKSSYQNSLLGLRNLLSLRSLRISCCPRLQMFMDEPPPLESCMVKVFNCPGLKEWCLQHNISYEGYDDDDNNDDNDDDNDDYYDNDDINNSGLIQAIINPDN